MAFADDLTAALDDVYDTLGLPYTWTPAGGEAVDFTGLVGGGDQASGFQVGTIKLNVEGHTLRARVSELAALTDAEPAKGDGVAFGDAAFVISAAPRKEDPRRLEWTLDLAPA